MNRIDATRDSTDILTEIETQLERITDALEHIADTDTG